MEWLQYLAPVIGVAIAAVTRCVVEVVRGRSQRQILRTAVRNTPAADRVRIIEVLTRWWK